MTTDDLIPVPTAQKLLTEVRYALREAAKNGWNTLSFDAIASAIAKQVGDIPHIFCYGGQCVPPDGCRDTEWLFDFAALLYKEPNGVRFLVQPAIVGEIEWNRSDAKTDEDFEKLLMVDSILCFFACEAGSKDQAREKVERYRRIVEVRRKYSELRGTLPPTFLLACYIEPSDRAAGNIELLDCVIP